MSVEIPRHTISVHRKVGYEKKGGIVASELKVGFPDLRTCSKVIQTVSWRQAFQETRNYSPSKPWD